MIWKWIAGIVAVLLILVAIFWYIPDLRKRQAASDKQDLEVAQILSTLHKENQALVQQHNQDQADLNGVRQVVGNLGNRMDRLVPYLQQQVGAMSAETQRQRNQYDLIVRGLLLPTDTTRTGRNVYYSEKSHEALTVRLVQCDTLERLTRELTAAVYVQGRQLLRTQDTIRVKDMYTDSLRRNAKLKGWFTGKEKEGRRLADHPPYPK